MSRPDPWDDPRTVAAWQAFDAVCDRYRVVNRALADHARLPPDAHVLDVGAGTGGTARACLAHLGPDGRLVCVEPAEAMRQAGSVALGDQETRVTWQADLPGEPGAFDRVLCGSSVWLLGALPEVLARLASLLRPGGALVFALPSALLSAEDPLGGGPDPTLTELARRLVAERTLAPPASERLPDLNGLTAALRAGGLRPEGWRVETRWTLEQQSAWYRLPPVGLAMRPDLSIDQLDDAVDRALAACAPGSWRAEGWQGFTAWR